MRSALVELITNVRDLVNAFRHVITGRIRSSEPGLDELIDATEAQLELVETELDRKENDHE